MIEGWIDWYIYGSGLILTIIVLFAALGVVASLFIEIIREHFYD